MLSYLFLVLCTALKSLQSRTKPQMYVCKLEEAIIEVLRFKAILFVELDVINYQILEINPCGLGYRIRDMEAEWRLRFITDKNSWWIFGKQKWRWGINRTLSQSAKVCTKIWCFWPLSAPTTSEVKNHYAHVITQDTCNKFIEIKFSVGCMVCP